MLPARGYLVGAATLLADIEGDAVSQLLGAEQVDVVRDKEGPGARHRGPPPGDKGWGPKIRSPLWFCKLGRREESTWAGTTGQHEPPSCEGHLPPQLASATTTSMFSSTHSVSSAPLSAKALCQPPAPSLKLERCSSALPGPCRPAGCCQAHLLGECLILPGTDGRQGFPALVPRRLSVQVNCKTEPGVSTARQGLAARCLAGSGFAHLGANPIWLSFFKRCAVSPQLDACGVGRDGQRLLAPTHQAPPAPLPSAARRRGHR